MSLKVLERIMLMMGILALLLLLAAVVAFLSMEGWQQIFWGSGLLILSLNMGLGFLLMRLNLRRLKK